MADSDFQPTTLNAFKAEFTAEIRGNETILAALNKGLRSLSIDFCKKRIATTIADDAAGATSAALVSLASQDFGLGLTVYPTGNRETGYRFGFRRLTAAKHDLDLGSVALADFSALFQLSDAEHRVTFAFAHAHVVHVATA